MDRETLVKAPMQEMSKAFMNAEKQMEETVKQMTNVAKQMQDGALMGDGADAFVNAINSKLLKKLDKVKQKMHELHGDVDKAVQRMEQAEAQSKKPFGS